MRWGSLVAICLAACGGATTPDEPRDVPLLERELVEPARDAPRGRTRVFDDDVYVATGGEVTLRRENGLELPAYCGNYSDRLLTGWCVYRHTDRTDVGRAWDHGDANPCWVCPGYGNGPATVTAFALCRRSP